MRINDRNTAFAGVGMGSARARSMMCAGRAGGLPAGIEDMNACGRAAARRGDT